MSIRQIIHIPDPVLREVSKPVERVDDALRVLLDDMLETMYDAPGIGLAGIQIGERLRIIAIDCGDREKEEAEQDGAEAEDEVVSATEPDDEKPELVRRPMFFINPEIVALAGELSIYEEGCLSIPEYFADVERPSACTVKYLDRDGKQQLIEATGILSTCLQHEIDHLNGKLFIDHISKLKRDMVIKKFTKIAKQSGKTNGKPAGKPGSKRMVG